jgi:tetratricopeptide (TPR) repeat protein
VGIREKKQTNFHIVGILTFIIGAVCTAAVFYFLFFPALQREHDINLQNSRNQLADAEIGHNARVQVLENEKRDLQREIDSLQESNNTWADSHDLQDRIIHVYRAYWLYLDEQYQEALDMLENINMSGMPFDIRNRIEEVVVGSYPPLALMHYEEGRQAFADADTHKALVDLELAYYFMAEDATQMGELLFMLGSLYYQGERDAEALEMLNNLLENFTLTNARRNAINGMVTRINERS